MNTQDLTIPSIVFLVLVLIFVMGVKLNAIWSVVIGLIGFGVTYYLLHLKK